MELIFHPHNLQLKHTFKISHGAHNVQPSLIVELKEGNYSGYGEATANPYYNVTVEKMMKEIESCRSLIENSDMVNPETFWDIINEELFQTPFALCALDVAANDLFGKKEGQPLYELWGLEKNDLPLTNYTIGIDSIDNMIKKLKEVPWPLYKIKLGTSEDLNIVKHLRKHTKSVFRVDANCAWGVEETINNAQELKKLNVEFIEQPLAADEFEGMKEVHQYSVLPIIADESCQTESDVDKCANHFNGINIKLSKCGGLTPARRMISRAKSLGMAVMVGCMTESTVGISAIAQLLPLLDYVDMDGPLLLKEDIASGVEIRDGMVFFSEENGTGAKLLVRD
ncbi:dipeptide epimerase [soil metagenome]